MGKYEVKSAVSVEKKPADHELFLPGEVGAILEITVRKKDGTVREHRIMKSKSFVRQFFDLLLLQMNLVNEMFPMPVTDVTSTIYYLTENGMNFNCDAAIGDDSYGVVVGTGNTAPTISDCALETQIADGVGAGQLQYGNVAFGAPAASGLVSHFTLTRDFANGSGGVITVNEVGLYVLSIGAQFFNPTYRNRLTCVLMTIRDVIAGGINVPDGDTLTINYRLQATA